MTTLTDPLIDHVLDGRYRIDAPVARGGMAMVYQGTDLRLDRVVALKIMHRHLLDDDGFVERFQREARAAAHLIHSNLVAVHDTGQDGDAVYLVMEYLPNVTLRKELRHRGTLTPRQALIVLDSILAALEAVHAAEMIHRDLKPDNVLLGADGQIKLADFGLARAVSAATTTKTLMGTVGYVAPELVTRTGADERTDLYTVGIMLYEMLTGFQPYTDDVPIQVAYRHVHDDVPPPSHERSGLSPRLDALVLWTTSRDPENRPQSATALREAITEMTRELTESELDLGDDPSDNPAFATRPLLVPTAAIFEPNASAAPRRSGAGTDEIPHLERTARTDGEPEDSEAGAVDAGAAEVHPADSSNTHASQSTDADPVSEVPAPARKRRGILTVAAVLITAILVLGAAFALTDRNVAVPAYTAGQEPAELIAALEDAGLTAETHEAYSDSIPAGLLLEVDPGSGTELNRGETVTVTVSRGEELFAVPDVTGSAEADARTSIESAGMVLGKITREHSNDVPAGDVVSQGITGDEPVAKGTPVDLVISEGVEPIEVPIVTGIGYDSAFGRLANLGFRISRDDVWSDDVASGQVVSQYPAGGTDKHEGDLIMLKVSKGKQPTDESSDSEDED